MKWMEFVAAIVGHLVWPVTLIVLFFLLREKISILLGQLARFKYKDVELDFEKVRSEAKQLNQGPAVSLPAQQNASVFRSLEEQVIETAERVPSAAILLAWSTVETALSTAMSRLATPFEPVSYRAPLHNIESLHSQGKISRQQVRLLNELRNLRNKLAHDSAAGAVVTEAQALEYASAARTLVTFLNGLDRVYKIVDKPKGSWIDMPGGFIEPVRLDDANFWHYSAVPLKYSGLTAGVGAWARMKEGVDEFAYYGIDVEYQNAHGDETVAELRVDLALVDPAILNKTAADIVTYNDISKIVTFDLGKSVFRYQIADRSVVAG